MWAAAIPIAASVVGGIMGADAAKSAANTQAEATRAASAAQERMFNKQIELQQPFRESGVTAQNRLMELLGLGGEKTAPDYGSLMRDFGMTDFQADPGYAFRQAEGMKGIESGAAARGSLLSGGALKAIQKYGQDLASQEYGSAFNRFTGQQTNKYNKLAGVVNTGQGATNQLTNAAGTLGGQIGSNIIGAGNAQAAGQVGAANAWSGALGQSVNAWQQNQLMDLIRKPQTYNAGGSGEFTNRGSQQTLMLNEQFDPNW